MDFAEVIFMSGYKSGYSTKKSTQKLTLLRRIFNGAVPLPVEHRSKVVPITFSVVSENSFIVTFEVSA